MKKILNKILIAVSFLAFAAGCTMKELEFSHEQTSFAVKDNLILIEAIAPLGLTASDAVYIAGPALGDSATVVNSTKFQMELSPDMNRKWGVYLDPADFIAGKTLADGFYFVVVDRGVERTPLNTEPEHTLQATVGNAYTVYMAGSWANDFMTREPIDIPVHKNFRIYIDDKTGWDEIALYMYSFEGRGVDNLYGGWPGILPTGTIELDGKDWTYFEIGPAANALEECVIFNNNGNGIQTHDDPHITFDVADFFFTVTADQATLLPNLGIDRKPDLEEVDPEPEDGPKLYILDKTTWGSASIFAHYWGNSSTEWPGKELTDFVTVDGEEFMVLNTLHGNCGSTVGLILHPNVGDESTRVTTEVTLDTDRYYVLTNDGLTELDKGTRIWVKNESRWPGNFYAHLWTDSQSTEWPGIQSVPGYSFGDEYEVILVPPTFSGLSDVNVIFHSDEEDDLNRVQSTVSLKEDSYYTLDVSYNLESQDVAPDRVTFFVNDQTGWDEIALYMWGDVNNLGGDWPGLQVCGTVTIGSTDYKVFMVEDADGLSENLIFNNNNNGTQLDNFPLTFDKTEYFLTVTASSVTLEDAPDAAVIFVDDQTGWSEGIALYMWGEVNNLGGDWPGVLPQSSTVKVGNVDAKVMVVPGAIGKKENLIFNNAGNGKQFDAFLDFTFDKNTFFFKVLDGMARPF